MFDDERSMLEYAKKGAEQLGVSINTFLLVMIANKLDDLPAVLEELKE